MDAGFEEVSHSVDAQNKRVLGFKAGGPGMSTVCGCTDVELLKRARSRHAAKVIYLLREDPTAVALSLEHARRSKVFVARRSAQPTEDARLTVQVPAFVQRVRWYAAHAARYSRLLRAALPGGYLRVTYEELLRSPAQTLDRIFGCALKPVSTLTLGVCERQGWRKSARTHLS